jgi:hypothetical protein
MQVTNVARTGISSRYRANSLARAPVGRSRKNFKILKILNRLRSLKALAVPVLLLATGCSSVLPENGEQQPLRRLPSDAEVEQYNAQVAPEERIVCRDEIRVGSNSPLRTCRYIRDMEDTSRSTRDQLRNILH